MIIINSIIKYLKILIIPLGSIFILPIVLSLLNIIGIQTSNILILIIMGIIMFISGFLLGKNANKKGYLNGIIFGCLTVFIMFLISLIFKNNYEVNTIIYYIILIVSSTIGSMFGIQRKTNDK